MTASVPLEVRCELRRDEVVLALRGKIDRHAQRLLDAWVSSACNAARRELVVDITDIEMCDEDGFAAMTAAISTCRERGLSVRVLAGQNTPA